MKRTSYIIALFALLPAAGSAQVLRMITVINPAAQISVTQSGAFGQGYKNYECLTFINMAPKTATKIVFDFLHFDKAKTFVGSDTLTRTGTFSNGVPDVGPFEEIARYDRFLPRGERFDLSNYKNCVMYSFPREGIAFDVVTVRRVEYEDGTAWQAPADASPSPQPSTAPSASI